LIWFPLHLFHVLAVFFNYSTHIITHMSTSWASSSRTWCSLSWPDWDWHGLPICTLFLLAKRQKAIIVLLLWFVSPAAQKQQILSKFMHECPNDLCNSCFSFIMFLAEIRPVELFFQMHLLAIWPTQGSGAISNLELSTSPLR